MSIPQTITDLAQEVDQAAKGLRAGQVTVAEYDRIVENFDRTREQWIDDRLAEVEEVDAFDEEPGALRPGDVISSGRGIEIVTPAGHLVLDIPEALDTAMMLVSAARGDLTRPWSGDDDSTILTRGKRHLKEV